MFTLSLLITMMLLTAAMGALLASLLTDRRWRRWWAQVDAYTQAQNDVHKIELRRAWDETAQLRRQLTQAQAQTAQGAQDGAQ